MSALAVPDEQRWVRPHICSDCGEWFELSYRATSELKRTKRPPICQSCRYPRVIVVTQPLLEWWKERFSEAECVEMAEAMWGPRYLWNL